MQVDNSKQKDNTVSEKKKKSTSRKKINLRTEPNTCIVI